MELFAFMAGIGFGEIIALLVIILFWIGLFLLLRSVMLWYWKIDTIITLMKEQKELLNDIYIQQGGHREKYSTDSTDELARKAKLFDESQKKS